MNELNQALKFVINEDIYLIDHESPAEGVDEKVTVASVAEEKAPYMESSEQKPKERVNDILVLFEDPANADMANDQAENLGKILGAIGQSLEKIDRQNLARMKADYLGYKYVISFTPNHQLPIALATQMYAVVKFEKANLIIADSLTNIFSSQDLKKKLWGALQQAFL